MIGNQEKETGTIAPSDNQNDLMAPNISPTEEKDNSLEMLDEIDGSGSSPSQNNMLAIALGILGAIVVCLAVAVLIALFVRHKRRNPVQGPVKEEEYDVTPDLATSTYATLSEIDHTNVYGKAPNFPGNSIQSASVHYATVDPLQRTHSYGNFEGGTTPISYEQLPQPAEIQCKTIFLYYFSDFFKT